jgi:hypothetical protein
MGSFANDLSPPQEKIVMGLNIHPDCLELPLPPQGKHREVTPTEVRRIKARHGAVVFFKGDSFDCKGRVMTKAKNHSWNWEGGYIVATLQTMTVQSSEGNTFKVLVESRPYGEQLIATWNRVQETSGMNPPRDSGRRYSLKEFSTPTSQELDELEIY